MVLQHEDVFEFDCLVVRWFRSLICSESSLLSLCVPVLSAILLSLLFSPVADARKRGVDRDIFERSVERQMMNRVMGYAFAIADANGIVADASGGWAQAPRDGGVRMDLTVPIGFGSNQKVLSGVALLDLLEDRSPLTVAQELDSPIYFFLPDKWIQAYFGGSSQVPLDNVKLRDILEHTSGIAAESASGGSQGTKIALGLSQPLNVTELNNNTFRYNNNNYTLLLYIIPALAYRAEVTAIEEAAANMSLADYNRHVAKEYGKLYTRYMKQEFLSRVPVSLTATCRPGDLPGERYAKQYDNRNSTEGFTDDADVFCRSQGSWSYPVQDMAHIWRTMEFGGLIVRRSTRRLYRADLMGPRLIYQRSFSHTFLAKDTDTDVYRGHGGRTPSLSVSDDDRANSVAIRLPWGYVGIAAVNSDEMQATALSTVLLNAFYEATRNTYEKDINRGGSDITRIDFADPDPALCAAECDGRADCLSWTYVAPGIQHPTNARCWLKDDIPVKQVRTQRISGVKGLDYGIDRPGSNINIKPIELAQDDAAACRLHCAFDGRCKSWTFVRAGVQGGKAVCWLKNAKPRRKRNNCCVSGLK